MSLVDHSELTSLGVEAENHRLRDLLIQAGADARAHLLAADLHSVLVGELHHRVKNMLAMVSAITTQSLRHASSLEEASIAIASRLHALGVAYELLIQESWTGAGCRPLIERAIAAFQTKGLEQFALVGDDVRFAAGPAVSLSMMLHELCTNAVKYGALATSGGRVSIAWRVNGAGRFVLDWRERDGPPVLAPTRRSFGTRLIERVLPDQLHGEARLRFPIEGLECEINVPLSSLQGR